MPPDTRHLERRNLTWFAVVYVPRPLRAVLGKRLSRTLGTRDLSTAQRDRHPVIADFNARIGAAERRARAVGPHDTILAEAEAYRDAPKPDDGEDGGGYDYGDRAEEIEASHGLRAAQSYARVASGNYTPIPHHVDGWLSEAQYPPRSMAQHRGTIAEVDRWCGQAGVADVQSVKPLNQFWPIVGEAALRP